MPASASFASPAAAGIDDEAFLNILRDDMDDYPIPFSEIFTTAPVTPFVRLNQFPVWDGDKNLVVTLGTTQCHLVDSRKDILQGSGTSKPDVYVEPETGYVYFLDVPPITAQNPLTVTHYKCRWTNRRMINSLYAGLKAMFPRVWQRKTLVIQSAVNQYEYTLNNDFLDPRAVILRVEWQEIPFSTERYHRVAGAFLSQLNVLHVPWSQSLSPGANIRVTYAGFYSSLSDLEPQVQHLPLWYAKGKLLMDKEVLRSRYDMGPSANNEQSNPPGISQNAGLYHMQQFERELDRLQRPLPKQRPATVYGR